MSSKKFIVPPYQLSQSAQHEDDFQVHLTREQIESFPPYNESDMESDEKWNDYEGRYRSQWEEKPIMHRVATDRNITPTTKQQIDAGSGTLAGAESDGRMKRTVSDITPMRTEASLDVDPSGPSRRWDTFEDRLRKRREEIVAALLDLQNFACLGNRSARSAPESRLGIHNNPAARTGLSRPRFV